MTLFSWHNECVNHDQLKHIYSLWNKIEQFWIRIDGKNPHWWHIHALGDYSYIPAALRKQIKTHCMHFVSLTLSAHTKNLYIHSERDNERHSPAVWKVSSLSAAWLQGCCAPFNLWRSIGSYQFIQRRGGCERCTHQFIVWSSIYTGA